MGDGRAIDRTVLRHDVGPTTEGAHREAAANDLAQCGHVRGDAVIFLSAAGRDAETDDLVEDKQRTAVIGEIAQHGQIGGVRRKHSNRAHDRLDDDRSQIFAVLVQDAPGDLHVVVGNDNRLVQNPVGQPGTRRDRLRMIVGSRGGRVDPQADQYGVVGTVITTFHLGKLAAAGEGASSADGIERGLGSRVGEPHLVK